MGLSCVASATHQGLGFRFYFLGAILLCFRMEISARDNGKKITEATMLIYSIGR